MNLYLRRARAWHPVSLLPPGCCLAAAWLHKLTSSFPDLMRLTFFCWKTGRPRRSRIDLILHHPISDSRKPGSRPR